MAPPLPPSPCPTPRRGNLGSSAAAALALTAALASGFALPDASAVERRMPGDRGRFLQVEDGADLSSYRGGIVEIRSSELSSNKNKPKILDEIRAASDRLLWEKLASSNLFESIYRDRRPDLPDGLPALRLEPHLTLDMGSRGKRFLSTGSTHVTARFEQPKDDGRSKLWIRIDVLDARTDVLLATFRGFGIGFGQKTITGGSVAGMAEHDLEVNYLELLELLAQEMADQPSVESGS